MKLNLDCIRDVLITLEAAPYGKSLHLGEIVGNLASEYSYEDICYTILKLDEAGYITARISETLTECHISSVKDITYAGHQFLANIRSDNVWNNTKDVLKKIGVGSVQAAAQIASSVITTIIHQQLGFPT